MSNDYYDFVILKKDETTLSLIKEIWALSNLLYMKMDERNQAMRYQSPKYDDIWSELDPILYQIEHTIEYEIDCLKQQIEKKKAETEKSDLKVAENRNDSTLNYERKKQKKKVKSAEPDRCWFPTFKNHSSEVISAYQ